MSPENVLKVVEEIYEPALQELDIPRTNIDPAVTLGSLSAEELLEYAYFLCDVVRYYTKCPSCRDEVNQSFATLQAVLGFANWYTCEELKKHRQPYVCE